MDARFICLEDKAFYELIDAVYEHLNSKTSHISDKWIDGKKAMEKLHCQKTTLQKLRDEGKIEYSKMGNIILYNSFSIDEYIESNKRETF